MRKLVFVVLAVFGLASVSFSYELTEMEKNGEEYVKAVVAELEDLKKQGKLPYEAKEYLLEGKDFLEFVEKVKQSKETRCEYAVREVMSDADNNDKYHYYIWSESEGNFGCMSLRPFAEGVRKAKKGLSIYE